MAGWHPIDPLFSFKDPRLVLSQQPTFLYIECLFLVLAAWGILDAARRKGGMLMFIACLFGGAAVELVTILHQEVGNFYHSQATLMLLGNREPVYMLLGCYGWIAYATMVLSKKLEAPALVEAAFAAILGSEAWALLDTIGAQFLWWTWHNSEPLYEDRAEGVPVASSFWIMASMASLSLILRASPNNLVLGFVVGPLATLGLMNVPFLILYHPMVTAGGLHASYAMWSFRFICAVPLLSRLGVPRPDKTVLAQMVVYVFCMVVIASCCDPTLEKRTSFGQPCAPDALCNEMESSFWGGFSRKKFTCIASNKRDLFQLCDDRCSKEPISDVFYTTCGAPFEHGWLQVVFLHAAVCLFMVALPFRQEAKPKTQ